MSAGLGGAADTGERCCEVIVKMLTLLTVGSEEVEKSGHRT